MNPEPQTSPSNDVHDKTPTSLPHAVRPNPWRRIFEIVLGIMIAGCAAEALLQIVDRNDYNKFYNDAETGLLRYKSNTTFPAESECSDNIIHINNAGFYGPDIQPQKDLHTIRIAIVGSSFAESRAVHLDQHFATRLARQLNEHAQNGIRYEVSPFGFAGNGTYLDILYYHYFVAPYHPDLVIDVMTDYELSQDSLTAEHPPTFNDNGRVKLDLANTGNASYKAQIKNLLRQSKLIVQLSGKFRILLANLRSKNSASTPSPAATHDAAPNAVEGSAAQWDMQDRLLSQFKNLVQTDGSTFMIVSWSRQLNQLPASFSQHMEQISKAHTIPMINLDDALAKRYAETKQSPVFACDGHWNDIGSTWVADAMYESLTHEWKSLLTPSTSTSL